VIVTISLNSHRTPRTQEPRGDRKRGVGVARSKTGNESLIDEQLRRTRRRQAYSGARLMEMLADEDR